MNSTKINLLMASALLLSPLSSYAGGPGEEEERDISYQTVKPTSSATYEGWTEIEITVSRPTGHNYSFYRGGTPFSIQRDILERIDEVKNGSGITRVMAEGVHTNSSGNLCPNARWIEIDTNNRLSGYVVSRCAVEGLVSGDKIGIRAHQNVTNMTIAIDVLDGGSWKPALKSTPLTLKYAYHKLEW